jgi:hypothetical protein
LFIAEIFFRRIRSSGDDSLLDFGSHAAVCNQGVGYGAAQRILAFDKNGLGHADTPS